MLPLTTLTVGEISKAPGALERARVDEEKEE